jgi:hypothetical protein
MKNKIGILKYNLEDPDSKEEMQRAMEVNQIYLTLECVYDKILKPLNKYGIPEEIKTKEELLEYIINQYRILRGWDL